MVSLDRPNSAQASSRLSSQRSASPRSLSEAAAPELTSEVRGENLNTVPTRLPFGGGQRGGPKAICYSPKTDGIARGPRHGRQTCYYSGTTCVLRRSERPPQGSPQQRGGGGDHHPGRPLGFHPDSGVASAKDGGCFAGQLRPLSYRSRSPETRDAFFPCSGVSQFFRTPESAR